MAPTKPGVAAPMPGPPPLSPHWREDLNREAHAVMDTASGELALANYRMVMPPRYTAPSGTRDKETQPQDGQGSVVPPAVPPIVPRPRSIMAPTRGGPGSTLAQLPSPDPRLVVPPSPVTELPQPPTRTTVPTPWTSGVAPGVLRPLPAPVGRGSGLDIGGHSPTGAQRTMPTPTTPLPLLRPTALPPSGIIGAIPSAATGQLGPRTTQINPVGGVIRNTAGSASPSPSTNQVRRTVAAGNSATSYRTPDGHVVKISTSPSAGPVAHTFGTTISPDPDNPWRTEQGVASVLAPAPPPRRHDPGPAIGLTD